MKSQLVEIKDIMLDLFELENVNIFHKQGLLECTFEYDGFSENPDFIRIQVVGLNEDRDKIGIHLKPDDLEDLEYLLMTRIETALRDGFETIYIHSEAA